MKSKLKISIPCLCILMCIIIAVSFTEISQSVKKSIELSISIVLPALFPFFVISELFLSFISINENNLFCKIYKKIFNMPISTIPVFIIGLVSGYPVGAALTYKLYTDGLITKSQAERLVCFVNNSGPLFIICSVGCGMLKNIKVGVMLYILHIFISICTGIILGIGKKSNGGQILLTKNKFNLALSIEKSFMQCIKIIGFVVFFGIINDIILMCFEKYLSGFITNKYLDFIYSILFSILEITNGISYATKNISIEYALIMSAFAISWSGLSVYLQTVSVTKNTISLKKYLITKALSAFTAGLICYIILKLTNDDISIKKANINLVYISSLIGMYILYFIYYLSKKKKKITII